MLRISKRPPSALGELIALEGRLVGPWVDELKRIVDGDTDRRGVTIDLRGLAFADGDGVDLLRALRDAGVRLVGWSGFVEALVGAKQREQGDGDVG